MSQNRNKLIDLFIGNISNAIIHKILEDAIKDLDISNKYQKEIRTSFDIAKSYREKINPISSPLPEEDIGYIKKKVISKVNSEIMLRISKGYTNIDLGLVEGYVDDFLKEIRVSE